MELTRPDRRIRDDVELQATSAAEDRATDAALVERSLRDPEAFAGLFDRHANAIHRYAARRLGAEVADDVMAETFAVAFQRRDRFDLRHADATPWLYGIATNLIRGLRRTEARRWRALARQVPAVAAEPEADRIAARVSAQARRSELAGALARLPARQRDVLLLYAWAELDYEGIATALAIPVGTVRSRLSRARQALREATEE
jgi:RNA polymerase sigma factor (sigma-70 family)